MARRKKNQTEKGTKIVEDKKFQPYVPADKVMPEFTAVSILLGALLAIIFGGANAYLGLRVGMTVSASIPAAVISMGVIRKVLRRDSILENNMVQTIGSAGESVAAGAIFTLPALFMWAKEGLCDTPSMVTIGLIALRGGPHCRRGGRRQGVHRVLRPGYRRHLQICGGRPENFPQRDHL